MEQLIPQLGIAGVICYIVVKECFTLLKKKPKDDSDKVIRELQEWHRQQSMDKMLTKLCDTLDHQTRVLEGIIEGQREFRQQLGAINEKVAKI